MRTRNVLLGVVVVVVLAALGFDLVFAQQTQPQDRRRRFDPAQMRERYLQRIKETAQIGDEEWTVLKPRIEKVQTLSRDVGGGGRGMFFGQRRRRRDTGDTDEAAQPQSDVAKALEELQKTLENEAATAAEIKGKLKTLREAREKAKQELAKAKEAVRELVTVRQEAQLVVMGILD